MRKFFSFFVANVLLLSMLTACGGETDTNGGKTSGYTDTSSATSIGSADSDSSNSTEETADATLTVKIKSGEIQKHTSNRPYDKNKKDISLILVVGQSNFTTSVGFATEFKHYTSGNGTIMPESPMLPVAGTVYSSGFRKAITELNSNNDMAKLADASNEGSTLGGVTPSLGAKWHELTGTTVVFIQAAYGATGMHEWVPDTSIYECGCDYDNRQFYPQTVSIYKESFEALSKDYNIVYTGYIWNQGEHDEVYGNTLKYPETTICSDKAYYEAYRSMHEGLMTELNLDFGGISVVRSDKAKEGSMSLTIARSAQYKACEDIDNLFMISTMGETCDRSMMDSSNPIHYSQTTFNLMGNDIAENLYSYLGLGNTKEFSGVAVYDSKANLLVEFDKDGKAVGENVLIKNKIGNHILAKVKTLGNNYTVLGFDFKAGDVDLNEYIDEFGAIKWTLLSSKHDIKTVNVNCIIE